MELLKYIKLKLALVPARKILAPVYVGANANQLMKVIMDKIQNAHIINLYKLFNCFWIPISPNSNAKEIVAEKVKNKVKMFSWSKTICNQEMGKLIKGFMKTKCPSGAPVNCPPEILAKRASSLVP